MVLKPIAQTLEPAPAQKIVPSTLLMQVIDISKPAIGKNADIVPTVQGTLKSWMKNQLSYQSHGLWVTRELLHWMIYPKSSLWKLLVRKRGRVIRRDNLLQIHTNSISWLRIQWRISR